MRIVEQNKESKIMVPETDKLEKAFKERQNDELDYLANLYEMIIKKDGSDEELKQLFKREGKEDLLKYIDSIKIYWIVRKVVKDKQFAEKLLKALEAICQ